MKIIVFGAGAWGTALAVSAARHPDGHAVELWARDAAQATAMQGRRENARYLPGIALPQALTVRCAPAVELDASSADLVIVATPMAGLRDTLTALQACAAPVAWLCKGFEAPQTGSDPATVGMLGHEIRASVAPRLKAGVLSGPSFALEVAKGQPTALVAASEHARVREALVQAFHSATLRVYASDDVPGVEVGGAVKNGRVGQAHVDGREGLGLGDLDQRLLGQLQHGDEGHHQHRARRGGVEQVLELDKAPALQRRSTMLMCSRTDSCSRLILWCCTSLARLQDVAPGLLQVGQFTSGKRGTAATARCAPGRAGSRGPACGSALSLAAASFICSYSSRRRTSSARGSSASSPSAILRGGSSMRDLISISMAAISRYSAGQLQVALADLLDVVQVLARHAGQRDVEDVEVLLADQVQQQVQRAFEGLQEDLQRVGRDVQVLRHGLNSGSPYRRPRPPGPRPRAL
jgi:hypothetical protein